MGCIAPRSIPPAKSAPTSPPLPPTNPAPLFVLYPSESRPILLPSSGPASAQAMPPVPLVHFFKQAFVNSPNAPAICFERPVPSTPASSGFTTLTYSDYYHQARALAKALLHFNVQAHDAITLQGSNQPEIFIATMAILLVRAAPAGIYPTDTPEHIAYKTRHVGAPIAIVESAAELDTLTSILDKVPRLAHIIVFDPNAELPAERALTRYSNNTTVQIHSLAQALTLGQEIPDAELDLVTAQATAEECAAIIFTSGTTGLPKACMLSNDNLAYEARIVMQQIPEFGTSSQERCLSYLPLSHIAAFIVDIFAPIFVTALYPQSHGTVYCARSTDLKTAQLPYRLRAARPTFFIGVPRVWEKMQAAIEAIEEHAPFLQRHLLAWAHAQALAKERNQLVGGSGHVPPLYEAADALVLQKIKHSLGLDECKFCLTASAPISTQTLEFFASLGLSIKEAYGSSECTGACTLSTQAVHQWGSIGFALPGSEVVVLDRNDKPAKLAANLFSVTEEEQGEICFRGRNCMLGYMAAFDKSDEQAMRLKNQETFTAAGFIRSGDKGACSTAGLLRITGRFKELIKTQGGEYVSPIPIENAIMQLAPALSKVLVLGDKRPYLVALCTPQEVDNMLVGLAKDVNPEITQASDVCHDSNWLAYISSAIDKVNAMGDVCTNQSHRVKRFMLLPKDWTLQDDLLTPALKYKRQVIQDKFARQIDHIYSSPFKDADGVFASAPVSAVTYGSN